VGNGIGTGSQSSLIPLQAHPLASVRITSPHSDYEALKEKNYVRTIEERRLSGMRFGAVWTTGIRHCFVGGHSSLTELVTPDIYGQVALLSGLSPLVLPFFLIPSSARE